VTEPDLFIEPCAASRSERHEVVQGKGLYRLIEDPKEGGSIQVFDDKELMENATRAVGLAASRCCASAEMSGLGHARMCVHASSLWKSTL